MALETVGAVTGSLSAITLFTGAIDCFKYVQLGRNFAKDYGKYRLQLDILELRMSRWGEAVGIRVNPLFTDPRDRKRKLALDALSQIKALFGKAHETSQRYESQTWPAPDYCQQSDMDQAFRLHHERFQQIIEMRQAETSLGKKFTWAVYHRSALEDMTNNLSKLIGNLEELFPDEMAAKRGALALAELKGIEADKQSLEMLQHNEFEGLDPAMGQAVKQKLNALRHSFNVRRVETGHGSRVMAGHMVGPDFAGRELPGHGTISTHTVEDIKAGKNSRIVAGNTYGPMNFWDN